MKGKILLLVCLIFMGSLLYGQSADIDTPAEKNNSSKKDTQETKVSMIGFGFKTSGEKAADDKTYILKLFYTKSEKKPLKGILSIGTPGKKNVLTLLINSYEKGTMADIVITKEKANSDQKENNDAGKKKRVIVKIGDVKLKESTTKFKDKVQTGKISIRLTDSKIKDLSGTYDVYLNVLPEKKVETAKQPSNSDDQKN